MKMTLIEETDPKILNLKLGIKYRLHADEVGYDEWHRVDALAPSVAHRLSQPISYWNGENLRTQGIPVHVVKETGEEVKAMANFDRPRFEIPFRVGGVPMRPQSEIQAEIDALPPFSEFRVVRFGEGGKTLYKSWDYDACLLWGKLAWPYEIYCEFSPEFCHEINDPLGLLA